MQAQAMERSHLWLELTGIQELPESSLKPALAQERPQSIQEMKGPLQVIDPRNRSHTAGQSSTITRKGASGAM